MKYFIDYSVTAETCLYIVSLDSGEGFVDEDGCPLLESEYFDCLDSASRYFFKVDLTGYADVSIEQYDDDDGSFEGLFGAPDTSRPFEEDYEAYHSSRHQNVVLFLDGDGTVGVAARHPA
tara:strand:+ start:226 stop:585 length:360 start_codon:yes stop_codon:yes gene_type:complete